jgi:hypothetical protein
MGGKGPLSPLQGCVAPFWADTAALPGHQALSCARHQPWLSLCKSMVPGRDPWSQSPLCCLEPEAQQCQACGCSCTGQGWPALAICLSAQPLLQHQASPSRIRPAQGESPATRGYWILSWLKLKLHCWEDMAPCLDQAQAQTRDPV